MISNLSNFRTFVNVHTRERSNTDVIRHLKQRLRNIVVEAADTMNMLLDLGKTVIILKKDADTVNMLLDLGIIADL
jgi:hypothetical protein